MKKFRIKFLALVLLIMVVISSNSMEAAIRNPYIERFFELYDIIHNYKVSQKMPDGTTKTLGYFSPDGVPYHAFETFLCEAPDYGHETTSETYSYYLWLEAMHFKLTNNYSTFENAWKSMENFIIPSPEDQPIRPKNDNLGTVSAGRYAQQSIKVEDYPVLMFTGTAKKPDGKKFPNFDGEDPLAIALQSKYGDKYVYGMHWLLDTDNFYGFGYRGDESSKKPVYLATCERGGSESSWSTIPHPNWKNNKYGNNPGNTNGFGDIFLNSEFGWSPEYSYSVATDADARAIQAAYMAAKHLEKLGNSKENKLRELSKKVAKMGDFLRYGMHTKYFMPIGRKLTETIEKKYNPSNPKQSRYEHKITVHDPNLPNINIHYLLGWNYAWGANLEGNYPWRIGDDNVHAGYQNPMAAYALSSYEWFWQEMTYLGANNWGTSLLRQLNLIRWLQTYEGAIGGGVTNCWNGNYSDPNLILDKDDPHNLEKATKIDPSDPNFVRNYYGMYYTKSPVYVGKDPITGDPNPAGDSNAWFGWQVWLMQRLAELYSEVDTSTTNGWLGYYLKQHLEPILDQWVSWALSVTKLDPAASNPMDAIRLPHYLIWHGQPDKSFNLKDYWGQMPDRNYDFHVEVANNNYYPDISITGNLARTLIYYAAGKRKHTGNPNNPQVVAARETAKQILDLLYTNYKDERGYSNYYSTRDFINNFFEAKVYVPGTIPGKNTFGEATPERVKREGVLPDNMGKHKATSRYGNVTTKLTSSDDPNNVHGYMTYDQIRAKYEDNPGPQGLNDLSYEKLLAAYRDPDKKAEVILHYHRFFSQVEIALAFAEFGIFFGDEAESRNDITWGPVTIDTKTAANFGVYGSAHTDFHDRAKLYITKGDNLFQSTYGTIGVGKEPSSDPQMIIGAGSWVCNIICGQPKLWLRSPAMYMNVLAGGRIEYQQPGLPDVVQLQLDNLLIDNPDRDLGFLHYSFDESKCYTSNDHINVGNGQTVEKWNGVYGNINVGSNGRLSFKGGGVFYCNNFTTEPDAILDFDTSTHPVIIIAKGNVEIKSRTQMNVTNDDASRLLIITASQNQVYLAPQVKWRGTLFAPNTGYLNVDIGSKNDAKGAFIGKSVVIHQDTEVIQVPFQYELLTTSLPGYHHNAPTTTSIPGSNSGSNWWSWWNWSW